MTAQNYYAILGMCAIVITCYALRNSEAHYLPDLLGLALALAAPRQSMAIGAWALLVIIRHTPLAIGLAPALPGWLVPLALPRARNMLSADGEYSAEIYSEESPIFETENSIENSEIPRPVAEITPERIVLAQVDVLARLVISGEVGLTKAIQIGVGAKSGKKYQRISRLVQTEIERQRNHYPPSSNLKRFD